MHNSRWLKVKIVQSHGCNMIKLKVEFALYFIYTREEKSSLSSGLSTNIE